MQQAKAKQEEKRNQEAEQKKSHAEEMNNMRNESASGVPDSWEDADLGGGDAFGGGKKKVSLMTYFDTKMRRGPVICYLAELADYTKI